MPAMHTSRPIRPLPEVHPPWSLAALTPAHAPPANTPTTRYCGSGITRRLGERERRVAAGEHDREERDHGQNDERDPEEHERNDVWDHQDPLDQPQPAADVTIELRLDSQRIRGLCGVLAMGRTSFHDSVWAPPAPSSRSPEGHLRCRYEHERRSRRGGDDPVVRDPEGPRTDLLLTGTILPSTVHSAREAGRQAAVPPPLRFFTSRSADASSR